MNKEKRVAFLDYSPHYAGAERAMVSLIKGLSDTPYKACIVAPYPLPHHSRFAEFGVDFYYLNERIKWWMGSDRWKSPIRGSDLIKRLVFGLQLSRFLSQREISILHVNLLRPDSWAWLLASWLQGVKIVGHYRSISPTWTPSRLVRPLCHKIVCVSKVVQDNLANFRALKKSCVVYDPVATHLNTSETKEESKTRWGFDIHRFLFASVAYLSPHKGHDNAIHAFAQLAQTNSECDLLIAGGGPQQELQRLKTIAASYPDITSRIKFTEEQVSDVASIYNAADVVLSLTKNGEAFGLVPYEAAVMGTPCIAPRRGAILELAEHGKHVYLVETLDVQEIHQMMKFAIEYPSETRSAAKNLKNLVMSSLTRDVHTRHISQVYDELLSC